MMGFAAKMLLFVKVKMMRHLPYLITCAEFEDFLDSYLDETLPDAQRRRFEFHLRLCSECRAYLEAYRRTRILARAVLLDDELTEAPEDLIQAVLDAKRAQDRS